MLCAIVQNNLVTDVQDLSPDQIQAASVNEQIIDISTLIPKPQIGWHFDGHKLTPPLADPVVSIIYVRDNIVRPAIEFGNAILYQYSAENVVMGITKAGKTTAVRKATFDVRDCLSSGSLYDAIAALTVLMQNPDPNLAPFITTARIKAVINEILVYAGKPKIP